MAQKYWTLSGLAFVFLQVFAKRRMLERVVSALSGLRAAPGFSPTAAASSSRSMRCAPFRCRQPQCDGSCGPKPDSASDAVSGCEAPGHTLNSAQNTRLLVSSLRQKIPKPLRGVGQRGAMDCASAAHKPYSTESANALAARSGPHLRRSETPEKISGAVPKPPKRHLGQPQPSKNRALDLPNSMTFYELFRPPPRSLRRRSGTPHGHRPRTA